jgi:drug/metabolite transporter (DMT)-like permease
MDRRIIGVILLVLGLLGLAYGGFTYTRESHDADIGPVEIEVKDRERVQIPIWAGVVLAVAGAALMITPAQTTPKA